MIKFVLLLILVVVLYSASSGKVANLPGPVIPTIYQKSKFLYDGSVRSSKEGIVKTNEKCGDSARPISYTEQTLVSVAGTVKKVIKSILMNVLFSLIVSQQSSPVVGFHSSGFTSLPPSTDVFASRGDLRRKLTLSSNMLMPRKRYRWDAST